MYQLLRESISDCFEINAEVLVSIYDETYT